MSFGFTLPWVPTMILFSVYRIILGKIVKIFAPWDFYKQKRNNHSYRAYPLHIHPSFYPANIYLRSAYYLTGSRHVTMAMKVPPLLPQCLGPTGQWKPRNREVLQQRPKWDTEQLTGRNIRPQQRLGVGVGGQVRTGWWLAVQWKCH